MQPRDAQALVLSHYAFAHSVFHEAKYLRGQSDPIIVEHWRIVDRPGFPHKVLGQGRTENAAWVNAARVIRDAE